MSGAVISKKFLDCLSELVQAVIDKREDAGEVAAEKVIECETNVEIGNDITKAMTPVDNGKKEEKASMDQLRVEFIVDKLEMIKLSDDAKGENQKRRL